MNKNAFTHTHTHIYIYIYILRDIQTYRHRNLKNKVIQREEFKVN